MIATTAETYRAQADEIVADLALSDVAVTWNKEIVALIAYLQRLGKNAVPTDVGQVK